MRVLAEKRCGRRCVVRASFYTLCTYTRRAACAVRTLHSRTHDNHLRYAPHAKRSNPFTLRLNTKSPHLPHISCFGPLFRHRKASSESGAEQPQLVLLFFMAQLLLRELAECHRLVQLVPMDMTSYYAQTTVEIRKAADELFRLSEWTSKPAPSKGNEERKRNKRNIPSPLYLLTHYSIYYLSRIQFLAKGCTNTGWLYTPVTPNPS
ncbi:hypothetical protein EVAR_79043_1 [Eumeta japonica]|uniref:Uncharacterized protein n=1 Tax=Eumeta variegata TaxID=151549 RepID=A0A4C1XT69_EUMVA|nr:hypothetical protein EVAR_79043_1 [Eumeta japonica]